MTVKPNRFNSTSKQRAKRGKGVAVQRGWLDTVAILAWGILLLQYWLTGKINVLLHPDYVWLAYSAGFFLIGLALFRLAQAIWRSTHKSKAAPKATPAASSHFFLFPPSFNSGLLLVVALFGLQFTPKPFASDVALNRGVTDTLTLTRSQPQAFRTSVSPEERSLVEWVRTLNVYPEPDAYTGQKVNVNGFVIHPADFPPNYLMLARFVITCCAADVYPVGLVVKLPSTAAERSAFPVDQWFQVQGEMITETLNGKRQLVIQASSLQETAAPERPYDY